MRKLLLIGSALLLGACNKTFVPDNINNVAAYKHKVDVVKESTNNIPEWYLNLPTENNTVFSVGSSVMPDMQTAVDLAKLSAKDQLADRIESKLTSQTKTFNAKAGIDMNPVMITEMEKATKNIIAEAEVNGYRIDKVDVQPNGATYRAYVLLAYNYADAEKVIQQRMLINSLKVNNKEEAWEELDTIIEYE